MSFASLFLNMIPNVLYAQMVETFLGWEENFTYSYRINEGMCIFVQLQKGEGPEMSTKVDYCSVGQIVSWKAVRY